MPRGSALGIARQGARRLNKARTTRRDHQLRSARTRPSTGTLLHPSPPLLPPAPPPDLRNRSMDSPALTQLFRQLFRHPSCKSLKSYSSPSLRNDCVRLSGASRQSRSFFTRTPGKRKSADDGTHWTKRGDYPKDITEELQTYPLVTAKDLRHRRERPRQVKMFTREFIDGKDDSCSSG